MNIAMGRKLTPDEMRVLRGAADGRDYRPRLTDWGHAEECVELGVLEARCIAGAEVGEVSSYVYRITPRGLAVLGFGPQRP